MKVSKSHGSPEQLRALVQNKIAELGGEAEVESATNIDDTRLEYLNQLKDAAAEMLDNEVAGIEWEQDDAHLYAIVEWIEGEAKLKITFPFDDLVFDADDIDTDAEYISNTVCATLDDVEMNLAENPELVQLVESATNTAGISSKPTVIRADDTLNDEGHVPVEVGYIQRVEEQVVSELSEMLIDVSWEADDDISGNIYLTATCPALDRVLEFTIPYADLQMDNEEEDVRYICDNIRLTLDDPDNFIDSDEGLDASTAVDECDQVPVKGAASEWEQIATKSVEDSDGFLTDYTLWKNTTDGHFECIFGDNDLYTPENEFADAEFEDEASAREWFDNYTGYADED